MKFLDTLTTPPRLVLDPAHLGAAFATLRERFPDVSAAAFSPARGEGRVALLLHAHPDRSAAAGQAAITLPMQAIDRVLEEQDCALLHAPFPGGAEIGGLFPDARSLFLRRAFTVSGQELLLVFSIAGVDAEFASRHGAALLTDRLRHRIDDHVLQTQIGAMTRLLEAQIEEVKTVKEKLLPAPDHRVHGARYAVLYRPRAGGGGDYFEIADLRPALRRLGVADPGRYWGAVIADVSGHGPGAAVEVAMLDAILRTFEAGRDFHSGRVLGYLNRHMFTRQIRGGFATAFLANYDDEAGKLGYASAGHPAAIVKSADPAPGVLLLDRGAGIPLGVDPAQEWSSDQVRFGRRDMLVLYTDGATEARSPDGREFGIEGILETVKRSVAQDPRGLLADIEASLHLHTGDTPAADDCTILVVQPDR